MCISIPAQWPTSTPLHFLKRNGNGPLTLANCQASIDAASASVKKQKEDKATNRKLGAHMKAAALFDYSIRQERSCSRYSHCRDKQVRVRHKPGPS
jgi:hypothetical protein